MAAMRTFFLLVCFLPVFALADFALTELGFAVLEEAILGILFVFSGEYFPVYHKIKALHQK
jgi:hypothetical protein